MIHAHKNLHPDPSAHNFSIDRDQATSQLEVLGESFGEVLP
ncbi:hypothetical protein [Chroococcidiopsis sp. CCMEE 29]|nr:hypothetical protein [Chroococcidiopsis sp. CCMEE 29]